MYEDKCVPLVPQTQSCIFSSNTVAKIKCIRIKRVSEQKVQGLSIYLFTYFVAWNIVYQLRYLKNPSFGDIQQFNHGDIPSIYLLEKCLNFTELAIKVYLVQC